jgi:hypothetical protein
MHHNAHFKIQPCLSTLMLGETRSAMEPFGCKSPPALQYLASTTDSKTQNDAHFRIQPCLSKLLIGDSCTLCRFAAFSPSGTAISSPHKTLPVQPYTSSSPACTCQGLAYISLACTLSPSTPYPRSPMKTLRPFHPDFSPRLKIAVQVANSKKAQPLREF